VGLLKDTGSQDGVQESIVFSLFFSCDNFSHFAVLIVIVKKSQQSADGRSGEGISWNACKKPKNGFS
jgi:hypothetical protein